MSFQLLLLLLLERTPSVSNLSFLMRFRVDSWLAIKEQVRILENLERNKISRTFPSKRGGARAEKEIRKAKSEATGRRKRGKGVERNRNGRKGYKVEETEVSMLSEEQSDPKRANDSEHQRKGLDASLSLSS